MSRALSIAFLITIALPTIGDALLASGTYPPAPPRLRADITREVDPALYNLGKLIYAGRAKLSGQPVPTDKAEENLSVFQNAVSRIPERAQAKLEVTTLAGQLSDDEARALLYYLRLRFRLAEVTV